MWIFALALCFLDTETKSLKNDIEICLQRKKQSAVHFNRAKSGEIGSLLLYRFIVPSHTASLLQKAFAALNCSLNTDKYKPAPKSVSKCLFLERQNQ